MRRGILAAATVAAAAVLAMTAGAGAGALAADAPDAAKLYLEHCAACHGGDRLGAIGPALLPENMGRLKPAEAEKIIRYGRAATQMPGFGAETLNDAEVKALAAFVFTPLAEVPRWGLEEMAATRIVHVDPAALPAAPQHKADPLNLFTVVEAGDHHVSIVDGDKFEVLARFQSRFALHGGAKYSPDGRFVYLASRDGWVSKYDLHSLQMVAEIRVGVNTRNVAVSSDGKYLMAGNMLPHTLVALDARDLTPIKVIPVVGRDGVSSRVSAVYAMPPRNAFVAALKDVKEVWEMPWDDRPVYAGLVHSRQPGLEEGVQVPGPFPARRLRVEDYADDFFFDQPYNQLMGTSRDGKKGIVVHMDVGRQIAALDLPGMPHLGSGVNFTYQGRPMMATPHIKEPVVSVVDTRDWKVEKTIPMPGPGFFLRSHENTPYAWGDAYMGKEKDVVPVIDLRTLEVAKLLKPAPGKLTAHVEFTRDGRHVLLSVMEDDGAVIVLDAQTFAEVKRLPMRKPIGKYNVWNKINYSSGTSH